MPYAADGQISQDPIVGGIEITQEQYQYALEGMLSGLVVKIINGELYVGQELPSEPEPEPDPTYQLELSQLNYIYQTDVDKFLRAFTLAYLSDGSVQDAKQAAIRSQYFVRKDQYTADVAALKSKYGV